MRGPWGEGDYHLCRPSEKLGGKPEMQSELAGRIHLCAPGNQTSPFNKLPSSQIEVIGSFIAMVE